MSRYKIQMNNTRKYDNAFFDTYCTACDDPIEEGDPLGKIEDEYVCIPCLLEFGNLGSVTKEENQSGKGTDDAI